MVEVNQEVDVEILGIDYEKQRLSLGLKQTQKDPWLEKIKNYSVKDVVNGKVTRIVKFGLFVKIEEGLEGLVHISELSSEQIKNPGDIAKIGDELMVRIIDIDFDKRRMAFSVKQVENPVEDKEEEKKVKDSKSEKKSGKKEVVDKEIPQKEVLKKEVADKEVPKKEVPDKEVVDKELNKKRQIKEILKEMKKVADIE